MQVAMQCIRDSQRSAISNMCLVCNSAIGSYSRGAFSNSCCCTAIGNNINPLKGRGVIWLHFVIQV